MKLGLFAAVAIAAASFTAAAVATHERPGTATPTSVALVPAFSQCTTPNSFHTAPLSAFGGSCTPPAPRSSLLRIGTLGAASGRATYSVFCNDASVPPCLSAAGDQEDIQVSLTLKDVRCRTSSGPPLCDVDDDYLGSVLLAVPLRVTDHANGDPAADCANPAGNPPCTTGTVVDVALTAVAACVPNPSAMVGSTCNVLTTADALSPDTVIERQRAVFEAGSILVLDLGLDADLGPSCPPFCGTGDERPFMVQGWFVP